MVLVGTIKYYLRNIYAHFDSFWVLESKGFIPEFCLIKTLCLVGNWGVDYEEAIGNMQMEANSQKAMHFISLGLSNIKNSHYSEFLNSA